MGAAMIGAIVVTALLVVLVAWGIVTQRRLVVLDENTNNAFKQVEVQAQSRFDSLTAINNLIRRYDAHEASTLEKVIHARSWQPTGSLDGANAQQQTFNNLLGHINALAERYPQLKADANYRQGMEAVNAREDQVRLARMVYNDCATRFNREIRMFPTSIMAGILGYPPRGYLTMEQQKMNAVTME